MPYFEWDAALDTRVAAMNEEHQTLIGLMNVIYDKNATSAGKTEIVASVQAMMDYAAKHFSDEEAYMASIGFPGLEGHKRLHQNLLTDLGMFFAQFKNSGETRLNTDFIMFLKMWLITHIRGIDTKYGDFAQAGK